MNAHYTPIPMSIESSKPYKPKPDAEWVIHCDGATNQSNPSSEGGAAFAVFADGKLYYAAHTQLVGEITNNVAELKAIFLALKWAHAKALLSPTIRSDSEFAVNAINGFSNVRVERCKLILSGISHCLQFNPNVKFEHVRREDPQQQFVDFLANLGNVRDAQYRTLEQHQALIAGFYQWRR